jgi:RNA recognition motif-containing protein
VFLAKDRETGRAKGFAFVSYADRSDAAKACEKMDGCKFQNKFEISNDANRFQSVSVISSCVLSLLRRLKLKGFVMAQ